ncbi:alpha/beta hydrolase [Pseudomonas segetis]
MPRFKIRNRLTPILIQALLRSSQLLTGDKLRKHGLSAQTKVIGMGGVSVPVRIIRPQGEAQGVVLDIHGGGWIIGNAQMNDDLNIAMVKGCQVAVVSIDYRLAATTPIEGLMEDCLSAARWLLNDGCAEFANLPVILVGESAGGHLAAATILALKQWPELLQRVSGALLYYGVYDLTGTPSVRAAPSDTLLLHGPSMVEALRMLTPGLSDQQRRLPPLSPLHGDFSDFPPALMFVGELGPLRDDTLYLAERWTQAAPVDVQVLPESPYGFIHFPTAFANSVLTYSHKWIKARIKTAAG